jgi:hypothetical protein
MSTPPPAPNWFIDIRQLSSSKNISLDLARHLPRRAAVGPVAVITDRPTVLLSVVRKRWSIIIREVQRQYSSTLQATKKEGLRRELNRLDRYQFAVASKRTATTDILFAAPPDLQESDHFDTVYVTIPLPYKQLLPLVEHLNPRGFLVTYTGWPDLPDATAERP